MSLINACAIFSSVKFHVVCTFFGDTICFLTHWKMIKIATLIDLHIVLTDMTVDIAFYSSIFECVMLWK